MDSWTFQPILNPVILVIGIAIVLLLLLVGPSFSKLTFGRRMTLTLLRLAVIGLAALVMFRPGCIQKIERNQSAVLLFMMDSTRSMQLPHQSDESTRWGTLTDAIKANQTKINALEEKKIDVRFFGFDNQVYGIESVDGKLALPEEAEGAETDIGSSLYRVAQDVRDQRVIGVILASDGVQNAPDPEVELTNSVDNLADREIPLWAMAFGLPANSSQLADLAITSLPDQHAVFVKNKLSAKATLVARGFANQRVEVRLTIVDSQGQETIVQRQELFPDKPYQEIPVTLEYVPPEPGQYRMLVSVVPQTDKEVALRNNELPSFLTVYDGGLRVLYLDGALGWEQSFLRRTIPEAAQGIQIEFLPIYSTNESRSQWPIDIPSFNRLFTETTFDVFILGDVDSSALYSRNKPNNLENLTRRIAEDGKGLLMLGGYHSFGPGGYLQTPLADVLPIVMDDTERQDFDKDVRRDLHIEDQIQLTPTRDHFLTRLTEDGVDSSESWKSLPKLTGANRFFDIKPNSQVLLQSAKGQHPILVSGNVGGRVLAFAGDSTWRWPMHGNQEEYNRFWRQIILWLANRDGRSDDNVWIDLPQRRYQPKSQLTFSTGARNQVGEKLEDATFVATLTQPDGSTEVVSVVRGPDKNFGQLNRDSIVAPGLYSIEVVGSRLGAEVGKSKVEFIVFDQDKEKANPAADPELMQRLASQTAEFGGKRILPFELGDLLDEIYSNPPETVIEIPTKWRLGETKPDAIGVLLAFVGLLGVEWFFRKKWGLV